MATQILITDAGRAALVAPGNGGTSAHQVVEIGLANAPFVADKGLTKLPNELKRITTFGGANIAPDTIHATLKDDTADQYSLYGFGLYLENGVLLAAYGQATPIMEKSPAALLLLSTDMQFATIDATQLVFGDASFLNPPATTERQGVVELATQAEVDAGADATRALTPKTAASRYAPLAGARFTGPVTVDSTVTLGAGPKRVIVTSDATTGYMFSDGDLYLGSQGATGVTMVVAGNKEVARALPGGHTLFGTSADDGVGLVQVAGLITAQTPAAGDVSKKVPTTEWVVAAIASASIGTIVFEPRTSVRAGFLKLNGAVVKRSDYPALWAYAQASGALIAESVWGANNWGCFSAGDNATTFRLPEMRGEFIRCWDDARGIDTNRMIGSWQDSTNRWHGHGASASEVGDHAHSAWTDVQGWHGHTFSRHALITSAGASVSGSNGAEFSDAGGGPQGATDGNGNHGHNVGIGAAGRHSHVITVNGDGANESRPRNIALLAMIRAY
ncbi:phage tail protein [Burkholderia ubonensis]|uniref:phage tail protein n=1 Tax=Burkholderia ubonensis TaxID=101571 RepID=UPI0007569CC9|nr:phage tail protein [Burkholderia ubonensis]KVL69273.1 phage tail protein [Burkholderia ubonensis]KVL77109.1 phage tail protein [Burkholderia ubonensis]KVM00725.1 phage tail protein [Burkholderia ubonensis]